jgi:hypothetical protein
MGRNKSYKGNKRFMGRMRRKREEVEGMIGR